MIKDICVKKQYLNLFFFFQIPAEICIQIALSGYWFGEGTRKIYVIILNRLKAIEIIFITTR